MNCMVALRFIFILNKNISIFIDKNISILEKVKHQTATLPFMYSVLKIMYSILYSKFIHITIEIYEKMNYNNQKL